MAQNEFQLVSALLTAKPGKAEAERRETWPSSVVEQTQALRSVVASLQATGTGIPAEAVMKRLTGAPRKRVDELLHALETLGYCTVSGESGTS
jgi:hypothetical protein